MTKLTRRALVPARNACTHNAFVSARLFGHHPKLWVFKRHTRTHLQHEKEALKPARILEVETNLRSDESRPQCTYEHIYTTWVRAVGQRHGEILCTQDK